MKSRKITSKKNITLILQIILLCFIVVGVLCFYENMFVQSDYEGQLIGFVRDYFVFLFKSWKNILVILILPIVYGIVYNNMISKLYSKECLYDASSFYYLLLMIFGICAIVCAIIPVWNCSNTVIMLLNLSVSIFISTGIIHLFRPLLICENCNSINSFTFNDSRIDIESDYELKPPKYSHDNVVAHIEDKNGKTVGSVKQRVYNGAEIIEHKVEVRKKTYVCSHCGHIIEFVDKKRIKENNS